MRITKSERGFYFLYHEEHIKKEDSRLASESSAVGRQHKDSLDRPGSSYLWIGKYHHLDREEVREYVEYLQRWLDTGRLS